jgi:hypothetical protein
MEAWENYTQHGNFGQLYTLFSSELYMWIGQFAQLSSEVGWKYLHKY